MNSINGWSPADIKLLGERTGQPVDAIEHFCRAIDKQLYLMLPTHIKKATLHFHLRLHTFDQKAQLQQKPVNRVSTEAAAEPATALNFVSKSKSKSKKIVQLQEFRQRRKA